MNLKCGAPVLGIALSIFALVAAGDSAHARSTHSTRVASLGLRGENASLCKRAITDADGRIREIDVRDLAPLQLASIESALFPGSPSPRKAGFIEKALARIRVAWAPRHERQALKRLYCTNSELWAYALRDTDSDGIPDYRINYASASQPYYGRFKEGDVDIDGDGIRNLLDADPFDRKVGGRDSDGDGAPDADGSFQDRNGNGIPDHADWRLLGKSEAAARIQENLYRRHGILLLERTLEFTEEMAQIVRDSVELVYAAVFKERGVLPTLRAIVTDQQTLLTPALDDQTIAEARPYTQSVHLYRYMYEETPLHALGVVVHEIAHTLEYAMDFEPEEQAQFIANYWVQDDFMNLSRRFGWRFGEGEPDPALEFRLFSAEYAFRTPFWWDFFGLDAAGWKQRIDEALWEDFFDSPTADGFSHALLRDHSIVGSYALTEPGEWHGEQAIAYLFNRIGEWLRRNCPSEAEALLEEFEEDTLRVWGFYHPNALGGPTDKHLRAAYPVSEKNLGKLALRYWPEAAERCAR